MFLSRFAVARQFSARPPAQIFAAQVKLVLLWLPATLGLSWAQMLALAQRDAIREWQYIAEEFSQNLRKWRLYGTTLLAYPVALSERRGDGYDGWLAPEDRYQEGGTDA